MKGARDMKEKISATIDESKKDYSIKDHYLDISRSVIRKNIVNKIENEFISRHNI